jgi:hypothetical protein
MGELLFTRCFVMLPYEVDAHALELAALDFYQHAAYMLIQ